MDFGDSSGNGIGNTDLRPTRRPHRTQTRFRSLYSVAAACTVFLYSRVMGPNRATLGRRHHGCLCESHGRCRRATLGSVSNSRPRNSAKRFVQPRPCRRNPRSTCGRRAGIRFSFRAAIAVLASIFLLEIIAAVFLIPELKAKELE